MAESLEEVVARAAVFGPTAADVAAGIAACERWLETLRPEVDFQFEELTARLGGESARRAAGAMVGTVRARGLTSLAATMRARGLSAAEILPSLLATNGYRCIPPLPKRQVLSIAREAEKKDVARPLPGRSVA